MNSQDQQNAKKIAEFLKAVEYDDHYTEEDGWTGWHIGSKYLCPNGLDEFTDWLASDPGTVAMIEELRRGCSPELMRMFCRLLTTEELNLALQSVSLEIIGGECDG